MAKYTLASEDGGRQGITARDDEHAMECLREWLSETDVEFADGEGTCWMGGTVLDADGETIGSASVAIDPSEPKCSDGNYGHEWRAIVEFVGGLKENPGVRGHGGGVTIAEACHLCGCGKHTDTWAQNPATGEQGLESVRYQRGEYSAKVDAWIEKRAKEQLEFATEECPISAGDREDIEEAGFNADRVASLVREMMQAREEVA